MAMKNHMNTTQLHSYTVRGALKIKYWKKLRLLTEHGGGGVWVPGGGLCENPRYLSSPKLELWQKTKQDQGSKAPSTVHSIIINTVYEFMQYSTVAGARASIEL